MDVDVLIVGSGPVGSTYARILHDELPSTRILMVEAGPKVRPELGRNVRNIDDPAEQARVRLASQGPHQYKQTPSGRPGGGGMGPVEGTITARQGTHLVDPTGGMPAAAVATVVGGQGVHWTGSTPRPHDSERIAFIPDAEWEHIIGKAEALLDVSDVYPDSRPARAVRRVLGEIFNQLLPEERPVASLKMAARVGADGRPFWTGPETILGPVTEADTFTLKADTLCRRLLTDGGRVTGALLEDLSTGETTTVTAETVIVCADGLRTPQLLWASGIRPDALGRYLTEHPLLFGVIALRQEIVSSEPLTGGLLPHLPWTLREPVGAMIGVGFADPQHPYHAQIMIMGAPPVPDPEHPDAPAYVILGWGCRKQPRPQDRVRFSGTEVDGFGMPRMHIDYELTAAEISEIERAKTEQAKAAAALGPWVPGCEPSLAPAGTSLHFQGTYRMGVADDGGSVCDSHSAVWGYTNLILGGNGLIPTATACNPTLTSVALAIRGAGRIVDRLRSKRI